uniref:Uncharacterized protein n=1 Tax=Arundo donax TaxID=35708 RepID=A0A0A8ZQS8_ARUDO
MPRGTTWPESSEMVWSAGRSLNFAYISLPSSNRSSRHMLE